MRLFALNCALWSDLFDYYVPVTILNILHILSHLIFIIIKNKPLNTFNGIRDCISKQNSIILTSKQGHLRFLHPLPHASEKFYSTLKTEQ